MNDGAIWCEAGPGVWLLKRRARDGGAVIGEVREKGSLVFFWHATNGHWKSMGFRETRYSAQRAVRRAHRENQP